MVRQIWFGDVLLFPNTQDLFVWLGVWGLREGEERERFRIDVKKAESDWFSLHLAMTEPFFCFASL